MLENGILLTLLLRHSSCRVAFHFWHTTPSTWSYLRFTFFMGLRFHLLSSNTGGSFVYPDHARANLAVYRIVTGCNGKTSRQFGTALGNRVCTCYLRDDRKGLGRCVSRVSRWRWRAHSLVTSGNFQAFGSSRTRPRPPLRSPSLAAVELHGSYPFLRHMTFGIHLCFGLA